MADHKAPENAIFETIDGDLIHYICQDGNFLTERDFDGELSPPEDVGPAKQGTSGAYIVQGGKRAIYCLNERDVLQDFEFDDEASEWAPGQLGQLEMIAAPESKVAAVRTVNGTLVASQALSGEIQAVLREQPDAAWRPITQLPPNQPLRGASIHAVMMADNPQIFYAHQDNAIHQLTLADGVWHDREAAGTAGTSPKSHVSILVEDGEYTLRFIDGTGAAYVLQKGELHLVGKLTEWGVQKLHDAEGHGPKELKW